MANNRHGIISGSGKGSGSSSTPSPAMRAKDSRSGGDASTTCSCAACRGGKPVGTVIAPPANGMRNRVSTATNTKAWNGPKSGMG